eukprot:CAMPEP_0113415706 /NCGR_PEP_ID=MMETSP0013_2-20120614/24718_1 /TAXON_ID=2843 ORGANISM="Skeletonema costatum, Strain 1716" /NCGR_SAMPLE_ID=MMETSP0013_2 /ASSEMBLY_ACC=CAM_ASM_000158 /LENGTH=618 /DNA_ID=CAMNT_0000302697 /DNA_START=115 /DNA_END=1971 /DNA_ORIENTATION=+ /assembly_acc=CAM_ASM_000158
MVITSPIKPSSVRMIRLKKEQQNPSSPPQDKENILGVETSNNNKNAANNSVNNNCGLPIITGMSSSLLNRLASCSGGRNTPSTTAASSSESEEMMMPPVDIINDEESESMQVVLSPGARRSVGSHRNGNDNSMIASCSSGGGGGRMSKLFKKSGSSSGGNEGSNNSNGAGDNNRNGGGGENSNNQGSSNSNGGSGDSNDDNNNDKNNNNSNASGKEKVKKDTTKDEDGEEDDNNNIQSSQPQASSSNPTCPSSTTTFNTARIEFAHTSTLPIHTGSESTAPKSHPSWTPVDGTEFKVRTGPNYPKNGKKIASAPSLYEVYAVRFFRSEKRTVGGATRIMPLPEMTPPRTVDANSSGKQQQMNVSAVLSGNPFKPLASTMRSAAVDPSGSVLEGLTDSVATSTLEESNMLPGGNKSHDELKETKIPDVLVVHFMLPYEPPNMFKQKDDGKGGECVYYLRPSQRFLDEISGKIPETPATTLFVKWCNECESDIQMRSRFKCMALVRDIEKHNMGLLKSYNGKPVLITESGRAASGYHGDIRYLEMTANVHYWAFMAKKGFVSLIPKFKSMQMEVGFTIEAHGDSEMPECMLGSTVLSYIGDKTGPVIDAGMQEPVHEHQS